MFSVDKPSPEPESPSAVETAEWERADRRRFSRQILENVDRLHDRAKASGELKNSSQFYLLGESYDPAKQGERVRGVAQVERVGHQQFKVLYIDYDVDRETATHTIELALSERPNEHLAYTTPELVKVAAATSPDTSEIIPSRIYSRYHRGEISAQEDALISS